MTSNIDITCFSNDVSKYANFIIDPLTFQSSQNSTVKFSVASSDFALQTDFSFLDGFNKLESLYILDVNNLTVFQDLPSLPSLQLLSVTFCPDELNQIVFPDLSPAKLKRLDLFYNSLDDEAADNIVVDATSLANRKLKK